MLSSKKIIYIFSISILTSAIILFLIAIFNDGQIVNRVFLCNTENTFMDHFNNIYKCYTQRPYEEENFYPPFCNAIYWIFANIIPKEVSANVDEIRSNQTAILTLITQIIISIIIILSMFNWNRSAKERVLLSSALFFSMPIMFTIERGNIIILSIAFLMLFIKFKSSNNKVLKEMAYISLAISAALKIYPAIFGLILIKEKKYKESIRIVIYGIILFFVPFILFGGLSAAYEIIDNISYTIKVRFEMGYGMKIGFINLLSLLFQIITGNKIIFSVAKTINYIYLSVILICFIITKEKWKQYTLLGLMSINIIPFASIYCILLLLPALGEYMDSKYSTNKQNIYYLVLFILLFMYFPITLENTLSNLNRTTGWSKLYGDSLLKCLSVNLLGVSLIIESFIYKFKKVINKKQTKMEAQR